MTRRALASLRGLTASPAPTAATIAGTHGVLVLPGPFYHPGDLHLSSVDGKVRLE